MPSYDFRCTKCKNEEVRILKVSDLDNPFDPCPKCGGEVEKVILNCPPVKFKGRGWFATTGDYSGKTKNSVTKKEVEHYEKTGQAGF